MPDITQFNGNRKALNAWYRRYWSTRRKKQAATKARYRTKLRALGVSKLSELSTAPQSLAQ